MKVTITIDTERLAKFGGGDESIESFLNRMVAERRTGGTIAWTSTLANVGTIDKVVNSEIERESIRRTLASMTDAQLGHQWNAADDHDDFEFQVLVQDEIDAREADLQQYGPVA